MLTAKSLRQSVSGCTQVLYVHSRHRPKLNRGSSLEHVVSLNEHMRHRAPSVGRSMLPASSIYLRLSRAATFSFRWPPEIIAHRARDVIVTKLHCSGGVRAHISAAAHVF